MVNSRSEPQILSKMKRVVYFITSLAFLFVGLNLTFKVSFYKNFLTKNSVLDLMGNIITELNYIEIGYILLSNIKNNV